MKFKRLPWPGEEHFLVSWTREILCEVKVSSSADAVEENDWTFIEPRMSQHACVVLSKSFISSATGSELEFVRSLVDQWCLG